MDIFGQTANGEPVSIVEINGGGLSANIMSWGAGIQNLKLKGHDAPLVLGFADFENYLTHSPYFGVNVGRCSSRIRNGLLTIEGRTFQIDRNVAGQHTLHGGANGLGSRNWAFVAVSRDEAVLEIRCADGNMGFPGNLDVRCTYRVSGKGVLSVVLEAVTDKTTICNLTHHSYFNLENGGLSDCLDHEMQIFGNATVGFDDELTSDGRVVPVAGTDFDFCQLRKLRNVQNGSQVVYDNTWCIAPARGPLRHVTQTRAPQSGVVLDVYTGEVGAHFYAGNTIPTGPVGLCGAAYFPHAGFCIETQGWPGSFNYPYFPQDILRPGETSRQETEYRFSKVS